MDKGYVSKELATLPADQAQETFVAGRSGISFAPPWACDWPFGETKINNPDAGIKPYQIPSGPDGKMGRKGEGLLTGSFLFSSERSGDHTSELQSRGHLVCRLLLS